MLDMICVSVGGPGRAGAGHGEHPGHRHPHGRHLLHLAVQLDILLRPLGR